MNTVLIASILSGLAPTVLIMLAWISNKSDAKELRDEIKDFRREVHTDLTAMRQQTDKLSDRFTSTSSRSTIG